MAVRVEVLVINALEGSAENKTVRINKKNQCGSVTGSGHIRALYEDQNKVRTRVSFTEWSLMDCSTDDLILQ